MKTKHAVWLAFFLNLGYAIVEFIAGGIFGSSAVYRQDRHAYNALSARQDSCNRADNVQNARLCRMRQGR